MKYDPSTVVEKEFIALEEGYYPFEAITAEETVSKSSGKDMIVIDMKVFAKDGRTYPHTIYITEASLYHLKTFWDSVGHPELFESMADEFNPIAFSGKCGMVKTVHEKSERDGVKYVNSKVHYFIKKKDQEKINETIKNETAASFPDDDIPF